MKGKFITFEGCEGVGKSRQIKLLEEYMKKNNVDYLLTREPGGSIISEKIRGIILDKENDKMTPACEALLYASARVQLLDEVLKPELEKGRLVICDRYVDSSLAYQGYARGLGYEFVAKINDYALKNFCPDYTVFLKLTPEEAFKRKGGVDKTDRVELLGKEFHEKVYNGYLELAKKFSDRFIVIDASGSKEETHQKIINALKEKGIL
ncbi:MAG: dTMP kinase [Clostridia bacterium]|nr:dTMP kinase [Clostridia bacterium]